MDFSDHKNSVAIVYGSAPLTTSGSSTTSGGLDAVMAKIVYKFSLQTKKLAILGGFLMGRDVKECSYKFGSITNKRFYFHKLFSF